MNREDFFIFQNSDGVIYAHTTDWSITFAYLREAAEKGFKYSCAVNGKATIYTIIG